MSDCTVPLNSLLTSLLSPANRNTHTVIPGLMVWGSCRVDHPYIDDKDRPKNYDDPKVWKLFEGYPNDGRELATYRVKYGETVPSELKSINGRCLVPNPQGQTKPTPNQPGADVHSLFTPVEHQRLTLL